MSSEKNSHGTTLHQCIVLAIVANHGPLTSGDVAVRYRQFTSLDVAHNYQYIITRRMADKGLIRSVAGKGKAAFEWTITPAGKKLLAETLRLCKVLGKI